MKSALSHGAASLKEATEAMRLALRATAPAQLELGTRARQLASSVGEGAGLVAVGLAASERAFSRRTGMSEWVLRIIVGAIVMGVGSLAVTFADTIKAFMGAQASKAVSGVLLDEGIRNSASLTASELAERLLADDELRVASASFLKGLMAAPETRAALLDLLVWALQEESTRQQLVGLLTHEATMRATRDLLIWAFSDPATRRQMEGLASWLLSDESFQLVGVRALLRVLNSTLDDKPLRDHAAEALSSVVADTGLQQRTGEALWNAVAWSVTPSILRSPDGKQEPVAPEVAAQASAPTADAAQAQDSGSAAPGDSGGPAAAASGEAAQPVAAELGATNAVLSAHGPDGASSAGGAPAPLQEGQGHAPAAKSNASASSAAGESLQADQAEEAEIVPRGRFGVRLHRPPDETAHEAPRLPVRPPSAASTSASPTSAESRFGAGRAAGGTAPQAAQHKPAATPARAPALAGASHPVLEHATVPSTASAHASVRPGQPRSEGSPQSAGQQAGGSGPSARPSVRTALPSSQSVASASASADDAQFVAEWKQPLHLLDASAQQRDQRA